MKIVYASASLIPSRFANSIHVMKMCEAFAINGHEVVLLAFRGDGWLVGKEKEIFDYYGGEDRFRIVQPKAFTGKARSLFFSVPSLIHIIREKPDLVYARNLFTAALSVMLGYKTIYETHTRDEEGGFSGRYLLGRMIKSNNLIKLVVISDALKNMLEARLGNQKIVVAHDGANLPLNDEFVPDQGAMTLRQDTISVGYVGHLYPGRGIEILCTLAESFTDLDFHVVGGLDKDVAYWRNRTSLPNLFFHGFVVPKVVPQYLSGFDILLMPYQENVSVPGVKDTSRWMSPLKMFEYMAAGKAIISSGHSVLREVLKHEINSLLVPTNEPELWGVTLRRLIQNPDFRNKLGAQARKDLLEHYRWEKRAERVLAGIGTKTVRQDM